MTAGCQRATNRGWPRSPWPANSCSCQRASSFSSRWLVLGRFQRGQPRSRWRERIFTRSWTSLAFSQLELSPFAARRSHLRVPQEMGVGLAGAKGLQPHPSTLERSPRKATSSVQRLRTPRGTKRRTTFASRRFRPSGGRSSLRALRIMRWNQRRPSIQLPSACSRPLYRWL